MLDRRSFVRLFMGLGLGGTLLPGVLWAQAQSAKADRITRKMIDDASEIADVKISDEHKEMLIESLNDAAKGYEAIHALHMPNTIEPAMRFDPVLPGTPYETRRRPLRASAAPASGVPRDPEALAFASARQQAEWIRTRKLSSSTLTALYLERLKRFDPRLKFVVTLTEDRAMAQARDADREIAAGRYRGPLHGLAWGAKDLLAVKGYPTTWGAGGFEQQVLQEDATVVKRLDQAGAVLVAKLTLGALAMGDLWFGGRTRSPWNPKQGSSGSSAGPASATAAGCVSFSMGSETLGSISSPSTRCGVTGLRPTFGLVPRTGAMALSWSMDKLGPICRTVEDCALVLDAIHGPDGRDRTVGNAVFNWNARLDWKVLRIGYLKGDFERKPGTGDEAAAAPEAGAPTPEESKKQEEARKLREAARARGEYDRRFTDAALEAIRRMGVHLIPVELPELPYDPMVQMLLAEAASAFDELTRSGRDKLLTAQGKDDWPNAFRAARFIPAVEYIQASRARRMAMDAVAAAFGKVDVVVAPTNSQQLVVTNLTGQPALILPNGFRGDDAPPPPSSEEGAENNFGGPGTPTSLTFLANLYQEAKLLAFARAYQEATGFHLRRPALG
ncbi:MAG: amidase [Candidatus Eisenbacteria bacterium]|nr:amidase [Candidatus Eisenbacteria bacterium]